MRVCSICGITQKDSKIIKNREAGMLCAKCYQRRKNNPTVYETPDYGTIGYNDEGKPICHICGKAYHKLMSHVHQIHEISAYEYKVEFGLETSKGIMSDDSKELASERAYENYDEVIAKNLIEKGVDTRYKIGCPGRTKDMVSEQTRRTLAKNSIIANKAYLEKKKKENK